METEISRLLAENIAIREEAINARAEAEKWRASHRLNKEVVRMKSQLEAKLSEVNALVDELGALPDKIARRSSHKRRREGFVSEFVKNPDEREARARQTTIDQEGRLPAILEDKCYPRKTLEQDEIRYLAEDPAGESLESPDLGPPPVAHFDESEPLTFNAARSPRRTSTELIEETERSVNVVSANVESKRKRRVSSLLNTNTIEDTPPQADVQEDLAETETVVVCQKPAIESTRPAPTQKAGAKRKLEVSELEDTSKTPQDQDDFIFQRKSSNAAVIRSSRFSRPTARASSNKGDVQPSHSPERLSQPTRKILAPKSTNSSAKRLPVSNVKDSDLDLDKLKDQKSERRIVSRVRTRPAKIEVQPPEAPMRILEVSQDEDIPQDPKTPGDELANILSPASADPSIKHQPKEMAITNSVEDVLNGSIGRGSRRARAAVSYAPPKLNTKLRREGKELVGAVEGISKISGVQVQPHVRSASEDFKDSDGPSDATAKVIRSSNTATQRDNFGVNVEAESRTEPVSPSITHQNIIDRRASKSAAVDEAVNRLSIYDPPDSPVIGRTSNQNPSQSVAESALPKSVQPKLRVKRHSSVSDVSRDLLNTGDLIKGHGRSASASKLSSVPQRIARRGAGLDLTESETEEVGGLRTRTNALTHRRSMLV